MSSSSKKSKKSVNRNDSVSSNNNNGDSDSGNSRGGGTGRGSSRDMEQEREEDEEFEPGSWECTVCTFRNKYEAFKCLMCDTRKGTSTRKPRLNPSVVQQQTLVQKMAVEVEKAQLKKQRTNSETAMHNSPECFSPSTSANSPVPTRASSSSNNQQKSSTKLHRRRPIPIRDALVVRSAAKKTVVTVDGVSFTITEFKPRTSPRGRKKIGVLPQNNASNPNGTSTSNNVVVQNE